MDAPSNNTIVGSVTDPLFEQAFQEIKVRRTFELSGGGSEQESRNLFETVKPLVLQHLFEIDSSTAFSNKQEVVDWIEEDALSIITTGEFKKRYPTPEEFNQLGERRKEDLGRLEDKLKTQGKFRRLQRSDLDELQRLLGPVSSEINTTQEALREISNRRNEKPPADLSRRGDYAARLSNGEFNTPRFIGRRPGTAFQIVRGVVQAAPIVASLGTATPAIAAEEAAISAGNITAQEGLNAAAQIAAQQELNNRADAIGNQQRDLSNLSVDQQGGPIDRSPIALQGLPPEAPQIIQPQSATQATQPNLGPGDLPASEGGIIPLISGIGNEIVAAGGSGVGSGGGGSSGGGSGSGGGGGGGTTGRSFLEDAALAVLPTVFGGFGNLFGGSQDQKDSLEIQQLRGEQALEQLAANNAAAQNRLEQSLAESRREAAARLFAAAAQAKLQAEEQRRATIQRSFTDLISGAIRGRTGEANSLTNIAGLVQRPLLDFPSRGTV